MVLELELELDELELESRSLSPAFFSFFRLAADFTLKLLRTLSTYKPSLCNLCQ